MAQGQLSAEQIAFNRLGVVRLAVFLAAAVGAVMAVLARGGIGGALATAAVAVFAWLVIWHERVSRRRDRAARSVAYYQRGLARLEDRWHVGGDDGSRFRDDQHLYATDLELFGPGSLFHWLSTTRTETGAGTLAGWLLKPADPSTILRRQAAVADLSPRLGLRHDLAIGADLVGGAVDSSALRRWLAGAMPPLPAWVGGAALALGLVNLSTIVAALAGWVPGYWVLPGFAASIALVAGFGSRVRRLLAEADRPAAELRVLAALVGRVAGERFAAPLLVESLGSLGGPASAQAEIRRLERLVDLVDARRNQFFAPVAAAILLGTQLAARIERWRARMGPVAIGWLTAIGQLEALAAFATASFEHPDDAFPAVGEPGEPLCATGLAHPLLPPSRAIRNDVALGNPVRLAVVSGSNMSGKSTLLKAIGTNLVLAFAGGPVRATTMTVGRWTLGASLVLRESLLEGRSRFFAEVLRMKDIVTVAGSGQPVFFLLDELLSGTNSHDRAIGARGILEGLIARGAIGIVTTHDLALTEIAVDVGPRGANWHLEDTLIDGRLEFDYRLKPGVVRRSNALELMKAVGLDVPVRDR